MKEANKDKGYGDLIAQFIEDQYEQERVAQLDNFADINANGHHIVKQDIAYRNGEWMVYLLFIDMENQNTFRRVPVKACKTRKLAEITGAYLQRKYSVDAVLAFGINEDELDCSLN